MTQMMDPPAARGNGNNGGGRSQLVLAKDSKSLKSLFEASKDKLAEVLPKHLTPERMMKVAMAAVSRTPDLGQCTSMSILQCVMTAGQLGLDCSGVLGMAYMVPFFNKNVGAKEATLIVGYRGYLDLMRRSGKVLDAHAHVVYAGDDFGIEYGDKPRCYHKPNFQQAREDDAITGAYLVAFLKDAPHPHVEYMSRPEIERIRSNAQAKNGDAWRNHFAEMARKCPVRRGIKYLPASVELMQAAEVDEQSERMIETQGQFVDGLVLDGTNTGPRSKTAQLRDQLTVNSRDDAGDGATVGEGEVSTEPIDDPELAEQILREKADQARGEVRGGAAGEGGGPAPGSGQLKADDEEADVASDEWFTERLNEHAATQQVDFAVASAVMGKLAVNTGVRAPRLRDKVKARKQVLAAAAAGKLDWAEGKIVQ